MSQESSLETCIRRSWRRGAVGMQIFCSCGMVLDVRTAVGDDTGPFRCPQCAEPKKQRKPHSARRGDFIIAAQDSCKVLTDRSRVLVGVVHSTRDNIAVALRDASGVVHRIPSRCPRRIARKGDFSISEKKLVRLIDDTLGRVPTLGEIKALARGFATPAALVRGRGAQ